MNRKDKKRFVKIATDMYKLMEGWEDDLILYGELKLLVDDYIMFREFTKLHYVPCVLQDDGECGQLVTLVLIK